MYAVTLYTCDIKTESWTLWAAKAIAVWSLYLSRSRKIYELQASDETSKQLTRLCGAMWCIDETPWIQSTHPWIIHHDPCESCLCKPGQNTTLASCVGAGNTSICIYIWKQGSNHPACCGTRGIRRTLVPWNTTFLPIIGKPYANNLAHGCKKWVELWKSRSKQAQCYQFPWCVQSKFCPNLLWVV